MKDFGKRLFDIAGAGLGVILLAPLMALVAISIRVDSPGPALFRQRRVGLHGCHFNVLKFRTMFVGADAIGRETLGTHDPRITRIGRLLRRTKMDELPQLINVLRGEMSLVGPRPEIPYYADRYAGEDRSVLSVRPGITDRSSLELVDLDAIMASRGEESPADFYVRVVQPRKLALQRDYVRDYSLSGDLLVIIRTVVRILRRS